MYSSTPLGIEYLNSHFHGAIVLLILCDLNLASIGYFNIAEVGINIPCSVFFFIYSWVIRCVSMCGWCARETTRLLAFCLWCVCALSSVWGCILAPWASKCPYMLEGRRCSAWMVPRALYSNISNIVMQRQDKYNDQICDFRVVAGPQQLWQ